MWVGTLPVINRSDDPDHRAMARMLDCTTDANRRRMNVERVAPMQTGTSAKRVAVLTRAFRRNTDVIAAVLSRVDGPCEGCGQSAPLQRTYGTPYLGIHHRRRFADGGPFRPPHTERSYKTPRNTFIWCEHKVFASTSLYSTVTDFARFRGLSTSVPRAHAVWYASSCSGTTCRIGESAP